MRLVLRLLELRLLVLWLLELRLLVLWLLVLWLLVLWLLELRLLVLWLLVLWLLVLRLLELRLLVLWLHGNSTLLSLDGLCRSCLHGLLVKTYHQLASTVGTLNHFLLHIQFVLDVKLNLTLRTNHSDYFHN